MHMQLSVPEALTVSRALADEYDPRFTVVSVIHANGEAERVDQRERTAAAVEGVRADGRITDGGEAGHERNAVDDQGS